MDWRIHSRNEHFVNLNDYKVHVDRFKCDPKIIFVYHLSDDLVRIVFWSDCDDYNIWTSLSIVKIIHC